MRVLITGANGYIGVHVVEALLDAKCEVIAWDLDTSRLPDGITKISTNMFDRDVAIPKCDVLLHLAWVDGFAHMSLVHIEQLSNHFHFIRRVYESGCHHIAVMGTMHEVGHHEGAIKPDTPCHPTTLYGVAKNALRDALFSYFRDKPVILQWLRGYYLYGDDLMNHSIFTKLLLAASDGKTAFPLNSGKNKYDFIEIHHFARQIATTLQQSKIVGIINCCTGIPVSLGEQVEQFIKEHHLNIHLKYGAFPDRPYDSPCVYGDPTAIRAIMSSK